MVLPLTQNECMFSIRWGWCVKLEGFACHHLYIDYNFYCAFQKYTNELLQVIKVGIISNRTNDFFMCTMMWCRGKNTVLSMWYSWQKCLTWLLTRREREINLDCGTFFLRLVLFKNVCVMVAKTEWPWSVLDYRRLKETQRADQQMVLNGSRSRSWGWERAIRDTQDKLVKFDKT